MKAHKCLCGKQAVFERKFEGRKLCKSHFLNSFETKVRRTINKHRMIEPKDKLVVTLSGGKNSSVVLFLLKRFFGKRKDIEILGVNVEENKKAAKFAEEFCKKLDIKFYTTKNRETKDLTELSVSRRQILNKKAKELGATKLVLGHNLDSEVESILMNYLRGDLTRLIRLDPKLKPKKIFVKRIKPLRETYQKEVEIFSKLKNIKAIEFDHKKTLRSETREFLEKLEKKSPGIKLNVLKTFEKLTPALKQTFKTEEGKIFSCEKCGEPSSSKICKTCEFWN